MHKNFIQEQLSKNRIIIDLDSKRQFGASFCLVSACP